VDYLDCWKTEEKATGTAEFKREEFVD
jgi:hypothetical protein